MIRASLLIWLPGLIITRAVYTLGRLGIRRSVPLHLNLIRPLFLVPYLYYRVAVRCACLATLPDHKALFKAL